MADYSATVGNVTLVSLTDGHGGGAPTDVFPDSSIKVWRSEYADLLDESGGIRLRYGSLAVRSGGKLVIVDTGLQAPDGTLLRQMDQKGVDREAVDLVVLTHLHPDHVGWNMSDGRPTFPRARYLVPRDDWDYWSQPSVLKDSAHVRDQVMPLAELNVMDLIEGEYAVTDELTTIETPGHTPGHISLVIASGGQRGFILGDVVHSPAQAQHTDWNPGFDIDGATSRRTRHTVLDRLESDGSLVSSGHYPDPGFGRFVRVGGRRIWQGI
jgi:glyoxylase-like metal-dependent hydrolase (beta-lactamase superfamily II)